MKPARPADKQPRPDNAEPGDDWLPLFPLQTVLFPGGLLPLKVFEARYLDLISQCLRQQSGFGVVCMRQGAEVQQSGQAGQAASFEQVGVVATLLEVDAEQAGILRVRCQGGSRVQLDQPRQGADGLWLARALDLPAEPSSPVPIEMRACALALQAAIESLAQQDQRPFLTPYQLDDAGWVANRWCELLPISLAAKQRLMVLDEPVLRLKLVDEYLRGKGVI